MNGNFEYKNNSYILEVVKIPSLSVIEEIVLEARIKRRDVSARNEFIKRNMRLVLTYAIRYSKASGVPVEDLLNIGVMGFMDGIEKFDYREGIKLTTFSCWCIERAITTYTRSLKKKSRCPENGEMSFEQDISKEGDEDPLHLESCLKSSETATDDAAITNILSEKLYPLLDVLTEKEKRVLLLRFGLLDGQGRTLQEVGDELHVTRERIRQIEAKSLKKLRNNRGIESLKGFL